MSRRRADLMGNASTASKELKMAGSGEFANTRFLTVAEVAEMMRVSKMTVYRLVHSGEMPAVRFGRSYRVPEAAVDEFVRRSAVEGNAETA